MIENFIKKVKGESAIVTLTKKRLRLNLNLFCMFTGKLGGGKSWSAISFAQELDTNFDVDKQVVFDFRSCMNLINSDWFQAKKMKIVIWDEPQITISNRAWQSQMNKLVNYLVSTFRHQNIVLIMAAPYTDFLDSQTMKLLHWEFQCSSVDKKNKQCIVFPKYQQYNPYKKKTYPHPLYVIVNNKRVITRTWRINKPDDESTGIYEKNKVNFTSNLNKSIQNTLDDMEKIPKLKENNKLSSFYDIFTTTKSATTQGFKVLECWKVGIFNHKEIAEKCNTKPSNISYIEKNLIKRGYNKEIAREWAKSNKNEENQTKTVQKPLLINLNPQT